jgi:hypothetical protein
VSAHLYIEGAESKEDRIRCREGFRRLLEKMGYAQRGMQKMPRLSACGGRNAAFDDFKIAHKAAKPGHFVAMLIDSEDPTDDRKKHGIISNPATSGTSPMAPVTNRCSS